MCRYWVMRTSRQNADFLWGELQQGRLRQGWGYQADQDLRVIAQAIGQGQQLNDDQRRAWRNRRMLQSRPDGIQMQDVIIVPHLPRYGFWSVARVEGAYDYSIAQPQRDFGHVLPVQLLTKLRAVNPYEEAVFAGLRQTMRSARR
jgi:hypothetical protein